MDDFDNPIIGVDNLIRLMCIHSGKSARQISRDMGRSENFISATIHQGSIPGVDLLGEIADACGFELVAVGRGVCFNLNKTASESGFDWVDNGSYYDVAYGGDVVDPASE